MSPCKLWLTIVSSVITLPAILLTVASNELEDVNIAKLFLIADTVIDTVLKAVITTVVDIILLGVIVFTLETAITHSPSFTTPLFDTESI